MNAHARTSLHQVGIGLVAVSLIVTSAGCGGESEGQAASPSTTTVPVTTAATPPPTSVTESPPTTVPLTTEAPAPTVPDEPVPVREMMTLTAGWSYASRNFSVPFTFTIPDADELGRWRMLFDTSNYLILTLNIADESEPNVVREEPGVSFFALPEAVTTDEFIGYWTDYAAEQESFTVEISDGAYLGAPAAVVSGTYDLGDPMSGAFPIRLPDSMTVPVASGERRYVSYLVPVGERTVMVQLNAHELDFDLNVTLVNQIVESVEFQ